MGRRYPLASLLVRDTESLLVNNRSVSGDSDRKAGTFVSVQKPFREIGKSFTFAGGRPGLRFGFRGCERTYIEENGKRRGSNGETNLFHPMAASDGFHERVILCGLSRTTA